MEATTDPESIRSLATEIADTLRRSGAEPFTVRQAYSDPAAFLESHPGLVECRVKSDSRGIHRTYHRTAEYEAKREAQLAPAIARRNALIAATAQPPAQSKPTPPKPAPPPPPAPAIDAATLEQALDWLETGDGRLTLLHNRLNIQRAELIRQAQEWGKRQPHFDGVRVGLLERAWTALNTGDRDEVTRIGNRTGLGWEGLHSAVGKWRKAQP